MFRLRKFKENVKPTFVIITGCAGSGKTSIGKSLVKELHWTYIDKDTATRAFTDYVLGNPGDRESDLYCTYVRPIEYQVAFKLCKDNLELGNSVILTIPFIAQITDYGQWKKIVEKFRIPINDIKVKFVWLEHNKGIEYSRIIKRNAMRDAYKIANWDEYCVNLDNIEPDARYNAYRFNNDSGLVDEINVKDLVAWILK